MIVTVVVAGICGGLAALIAKLVVPDPKAKGTRYVLVFCGVFGVLGVVSRGYVVPYVNAGRASADAERYLREDPLWSILVARHPEIGDRFTQLMIDLARSGASREQARAQALDLGRALVPPYFSQYAPHASSESLVGYTTTMVSVIEGLHGKANDSCYYFLFGQGSEGASVLTDLTPEQKTEMMAALTNVIKSALSQPVDSPSQEKGQALLEQLVQILAHGHDDGFMTSLAALGEPRKANVDRGSLCWATLEMYRELLKMPEPARSTLMRHMFGSET